MANFILDLLAQRAASNVEPGNCPSARELLGTEPSSVLTEAGSATLAQHILDCANCANRWEIIQADRHVDLAELYVLERLSEELFTRLRARQHLSRCRRCPLNERALDNLIFAENPRSVHYGNLVTLLRQGPESLLTLRTPEGEVLPAIVLHPNGEPYIRSNEIERVELLVRRAVLTEEGQLTVELKIPSGFSQAQLAVSRESSSVMFPPNSPQQNLAQFVAETRIRGAERRLSTSQLSAWVTRP